MKIEVWSDFVCPYCYIEKRQLEYAISQSGYQDQIEVEYRSYILDPKTPVDSAEPASQGMSKKYGLSETEMKKMAESLKIRAQEFGLAYNFDDMKNSNTLKAHLLTKWAGTKNKESLLIERFLQAHFLEGKALGLNEVLLSLVKELGLPVEDAAAVIENNDYAIAVQDDIQLAQQLGARGVPFVVINRKYAIAGSQPQETFVKTIIKAAKEETLQKPLKMQGENGATCSNDSCSI